MYAAGVAGDATTYNALVRLCETGRQWRKAQALFEEMLAYGVQPDPALITFGRLAKACLSGATNAYCSKLRPWLGPPSPGEAVPAGSTSDSGGA